MTAKRLAITQASMWASASGYTLVLLMPLLLILGTVLSLPYLAIGVAFLVLPLMRMVFGAYRDAHSIAWSEAVATALHWLPAAYAVLLVASQVLVAAWLGQHAQASALTLVGIGLGLWITLLFGLCSAHELLHRRDLRERLMGAMLAGAVGYPALALEHPMHHAREGNEDLAEWPRFDESVWTFAARRLRRIAAEFAATVFASTPNALTSGLRTQALLAVSITTATAAMFAVFAGPIGLLIYLLAAFGSALGMQIMTYLQHWALADSSWVGDRAQPLAWEDDCQFQAWITLHISFHQRHHQTASVPFYRLGLDAASPRLPAGYILMMVICMVPPLWRWAMLSALAAWKVNPNVHPSAGRRLTCFGLYRQPAGGGGRRSGV